MFKKCQVVMLPSEAPIVSPMGPNYIKGLSLWESQSTKCDRNLSYELYTDGQHVPNPQNLYILSDEEIKEGDCCFHIPSNTFFKIDKSIFIKLIETLNTSRNYKKIITTTDKSLTTNKYETTLTTVLKNIGHSYNLPKPSEGFIKAYIEAYNSGNPITEVMVEYEIGINLMDEEKQILKVNPKDNTITIKKIKDSWSREEVIVLLTKYNNETHPYLEDWIKQNL